MSSDTETQATPRDAMFTDRQMRKLRIAIGIMTVILVVGFATVIGRLVYLLNRPASGEAAAAAISSVPLRMALPAGAVVRTLAMSGNRLAVHYDAPGGSGIAVLDLASGGPARRVELVTEPPK